MHRTACQDLSKEKIHKRSEETDKKNFLYYNVVLCISIVCLATTIFIYGFFRKVMVNFTAMLLLAFLTLVLQTNLKAELTTKTTCTVLSLINQLSFLATFSLMAILAILLLSYRI